VSHLTYVRQKNRDHGVPLSELSLEVTDHDRERAEDTVAELERLGVYQGSGAESPRVADSPPSGAASDEPPATEAPASDPHATESPRQQVTDLWGNPLSSRRFRKNR
jgi:hypothetical protein